MHRAQNIVDLVEDQRMCQAKLIYMQFIVTARITSNTIYTALNFIMPYF